MGNHLGDLLLIDYDTVQRNRLDRGRLLVAMQGEKSWPHKVKVVEGSKSFSVSIEKDELPVD